MADLLSIGSSALIAYQNALATTSNNIANVNTAGYTRQRVEMTQRGAEASGAGYIGLGVEQTTVRRITDLFVTERLRMDASGVGREEILGALAGRVDQLLSGASTGITSSLTAFYSALDGVAANPSDPAARSALIGAANTLANRMELLDTGLDQLSSEISSRVMQDVTTVNSLATQIAELNGRIALATGQFGQPPNDLLDQREQLLNDLAGKIGVSTTMQEDGSVNVFVAGGQPLVLGQRATTLSVRPTDGDSRGGLDLFFGTGAGAVNITSQVTGGELEGLIDAQRLVLDSAQGQLGRIAVALSSEFNELQTKGIDLGGDIGEPLFASFAPEVTSFSANTGNAAVTASFADVGALTGEDYLLRYDGATWNLTSRSTGQAVTLSGSGTVGSPFVGAGLSIVVGPGAAASGDRYVIRPTSTAAGEMSVLISDPSKIAAALPSRVETAIGNTGGATPSLAVTDGTNVNLQTAVQIAFTSATTYTLNGSGPFAYTAGTPISYNGWNVSFTGTPASGDTFDVRPNGANSGDNGNARLLANLRTAGVLDGGTTSFVQGYSSLVAQTGTIAQQATLRGDAQRALMASDAAFRDSVSGVNLDEEAANIVRFQKAYQAAAQIIAVSNTVFDTLLAALRR